MCLGPNKVSCFVHLQKMTFGDSNVHAYEPENKTYSLSFWRCIMHILVCHVGDVLFMGSTCVYIIKTHNIRDNHNDPSYLQMGKANVPLIGRMHFRHHISPNAQIYMFGFSFRKYFTTLESQFLVA